MKYSLSTLPPLPPRLSMDEYADFIEASLRESSADRVTRQKTLEERIVAPFRMTGNNRKRSNIKNKTHAGCRR